MKKLRIQLLMMKLLKAAMCISLLTGHILSVHSVQAAQELMLSGSEKLKGTVSSSKINRITFGSGHFSRIVGDSSKYHVIIDELGANLFLTSKSAVGSEFEISIVNASGLVADLVLSVKDIPGQIINIHDEPAYNRNANASKNKSEREVANLLKAMITDTQDKYYVKTVKRPLKTNNLNLDNATSVIQDRTYRYGNLTGARLVVKNKNTKGSDKHAIELKEEDFKYMFESVKAVAISNKTLTKNNLSYVWVITKDEKDMEVVR